MAKEKKKIKATDNGKRTRRYEGRKGYAERIRTEKKQNADVDAAKTSGSDSKD